MNNFSFLDIPVSTFSFSETIALIVENAIHPASNNQAILISNVHMLMEAAIDRNFRNVLQESRLNTADGMPLVWLGKIAGVKNMERVAGMDLLPALIEAAKNNDRLKIFLYGGEEELLTSIKMKSNSGNRSPIIGSFSPEFKPFTEESVRRDLQLIEKSGANLVFVSLGCPKQEKWISEASKNSKAVFIGFGGAFSIYAGTRKRAPKFIRTIGLEWLFRLFQEPGRLFWRYFWTNSLFLLLCIFWIPFVLLRRVFKII